MTCHDLCDVAYGLTAPDEHLQSCGACRAGLERLRRERELFEEAVRVPAAPFVRRPARWPHAGFAALLLLGLCALLFRSPEEIGAPAARQDDPEALVRRLGEEDVEARARAAEALLKLGPKAEAALRKGLDAEEPEIRARAFELLERLRTLNSRGKLWMKRGAPEPAVEAALKWLERHQSPDGSWAVRDVRCGCAGRKGEEDQGVGVTALALLAFTGAGRGSDDPVVAKGLTWLLGKQERAGGVGDRTAVKHMYGHVLATMALADAYGLGKPDFLREPALRAAEFTLASQNPGSGWRYTPLAGDNDTSVTMWAALSLRVAWHAGIDVPAVNFDGAKAWIESVTDPAFFRAGYNAPGTGKVFIPGVNETFDHHETLTAGAVLIRLMLGEKAASDACRAGGDLLLKDLPVWDRHRIDFYYWHFGSLALFQRDGAEGAGWMRWNEKLRPALLENQRREGGCAAGSWAPVDRWGGVGGIVYATALNALTLLTPTRFAR